MSVRSREVDGSRCRVELNYSEKTLSIYRRAYLARQAYEARSEFMARRLCFKQRLVGTCCSRQCGDVLSSVWAELVVVERNNERDERYRVYFKLFALYTNKRIGL